MENSESRSKEKQTPIVPLLKKTLLFSCIFFFCEEFLPLFLCQAFVCISWLWSYWKHNFGSCSFGKMSPGQRHLAQDFFADSAPSQVSFADLWHAPWVVSTSCSVPLGAGRQSAQVLPLGISQNRWRRKHFSGYFCFIILVWKTLNIYRSRKNIIIDPICLLLTSVIICLWSYFT